jgi:hypothetical protein
MSAASCTGRRLIGGQRMQPKMSLVNKLPAEFTAPMRRRSASSRVGVLLLLTLTAGLAACAGSTGSPSRTPEQSATLARTAGVSASPDSVPTPTPTATPASGSFTVTGSPIVPFVRNAAVLLADGRVLVVSDDSSAAQLYDPATGTFSLTGPMAWIGSPIDAATRLGNGEVLVIGVGAAELYDPGSRTFRLAAPVVTERYGYTAAPLQDGRVLIVGGVGPKSDTDFLASAEIYDPTTGKFSPTGSMHTAREDATATLLPDGRVLIAGGDQGVCGACGYINILASAEVYDPATGRFSTTGSMTNERTWHTATALADGRVLIAGGAGPKPDQDYLASAEIYDPATAKFSATGSMTTAREWHTATRLQDGRVLIAGGAGPNGLSSAEIYDPATATFSQTGDMHARRSEHSATLLADGRVLIAGGAQTGCELYWP